MRRDHRISARPRGLATAVAVQAAVFPVLVYLSRLHYAGRTGRDPTSVVTATLAMAGMLACLGLWRSAMLEGKEWAWWLAAVGSSAVALLSASASFSDLFHVGGQSAELLLKGGLVLFCVAVAVGAVRELASTAGLVPRNRGR